MNEKLHKKKAELHSELKGRESLKNAPLDFITMCSRHIGLIRLYYMLLNINATILAQIIYIICKTHFQGIKASINL